MPIASNHNVITEVSDTPHLLNVLSTKISFPLYGMFTIAEMVKAIENISAVTVTHAVCENDIVTLTVEPIETGQPVSEEHFCIKCGHDECATGYDLCELCLWE